MLVERLSEEEQSINKQTSDYILKQLKEIQITEVDNRSYSQVVAEGRRDEKSQD